MKIECTPQDDHQVKLVVEFENEEMESAKRRAARKVAKRTKIPGFRPGKAPYAVIVRQLGEAAIIEDAVDILIDEQYPNIIEESGIEPYGPGKLENIESLEPTILEFVVPLKPVVELGESLSIRRPYAPPLIDDGDVDNVLENIRERQAVTEPVDRPAEVSDLIKITLHAVDQKNQEENGEELFPERTISVILQSEDSDEKPGQDKEWPFQGFTKNLLGVSPGDKKSIKHEYIEEDPEPFKNRNIVFDVNVEEVQSRTLPEMDDEFAEKFGGYPDIKSMRADIYNNLEKQNLETYNEAYDDDILTEAIEQCTFQYPPQALDSEIDTVINNLKSNLERQKLDIDVYKKSRDIDDDGLRDEALPVAEERLKRTLFLYKIADEENLEVDDSQVHTEAQQTLDYLSQSLSYKEAKKLSNENLITNLEWNIRADLITKLAMDYFRDICRGKFDELDSESEDDMQLDAETTNENIADNNQAVDEPIPSENEPKAENELDNLPENNEVAETQK